MLLTDLNRSGFPVFDQANIPEILTPEGQSKLTSKCEATSAGWPISSAKMNFMLGPVDVPFTPPDAAGEFFVIRPADGVIPLYHGTSEWFSRHVEQHGFLLHHSLFGEEECRVIRAYSGILPFVEAFALDNLCSGYRLSLTRKSTLALDYASIALRGGRFRTATELLGRLLEIGASTIPASETLVLNRVAERLSEIPKSAGVVYRIELNEDEMAKLDGHDPAYVPFDIAPERITHRMTIP